MEKLSPFCIDGEIIEKKEVTMEILPKAIHFIVPE
jgi:diacylglycerol kinase family enzyme